MYNETRFRIHSKDNNELFLETDNKIRQGINRSFSTIAKSSFTNK